jgi:hypothetical protein
MCISALTLQSLFLMQDTYQPLVVANKDNYQFTKLYCLHVNRQYDQLFSSERHAIKMYQHSVRLQEKARPDLKSLRL